MEFEFSNEIWEWRGPAPFYFVSVPEDQADEIREAAKKYGIEALITDDYLEVEAKCAELSPELVLGTQMERHIAKRLGVPCAVISTPGQRLGGFWPWGGSFSRVGQSFFMGWGYGLPGGSCMPRWSGRLPKAWFLRRQCVCARCMPAVALW